MRSRVPFGPIVLAQVIEWPDPLPVAKRGNPIVSGTDFQESRRILQNESRVTDR